MILAGWLLAGCTVDSGFLDGKPCGEGDVCASGYTCVWEPCGVGYMCSVCRRNPGDLDAGPDGEPDGTDGDSDEGGDEPPSCSQSPPPCKSLPDCQDVAPECIDDVWICQTGYQEPETSCDFLDNDCDGLTDTGLVCRLAGDGEAGFNDGTGEQARFDHPRALLGLPLGDLLVADLGNHAIRRVEPDGTTTTLAGSGQGGHQDGPGDQALFREPAGLALNIDGTVLVADRQNHRIRQIDMAGNVSTLAGSGFVDYQDGPVDQASFAFPTGLAVSGDAILVADAGNHCIRKIAGGQVTTFAGRCGYPGLADGDAATARFNGPTDLLLLSDGRLLVSEESSHRIRVVDQDGTASTLAGDGQYGFADGDPATARFAKPAGLIADPVGGSHLVADSGNHRVRAIDEFEVSTRLGSGHPGPADGPPGLVEFDHPSGLAYFSDGRLVIADTNNHMLRVQNP